VTTARRGSQRGQATVELALLLPVVVLLVLAVLQLGLVARDVVLVTHAAREAARAAAVDPEPDAAIRAARAAGRWPPRRAGRGRARRRGPGSRVRVEVTYRIPTSVPLVGSMLGDRTVRSTMTMRVEHP
jgi:hypothetical protein